MINLENKIRYVAERDYVSGSVTAFASELLEVIDKYKDMLKKLEWVMDDQWEEELCPMCLGWKKNGHNRDCELMDILK